MSEANDIKNAYLDQFLEQIEAAGGRIEREQLKRMSVDELFFKCASNRIEVACNYVPPHMEPIAEGYENNA